METPQNNPQNSKIPQTPTQTPTPIPPKKSDGLKIFLGSLVFLLLLTNVFTVFYLYSKSSDNKQIEDTRNFKNEEITNTAEEKIIDEIIEEVAEEEDEEKSEEIKLAANEMLVEWYNEPIVTTAEDLFGQDKINQHKSSVKYSVLDNGDLTIEKFGAIEKGVYEDGELYSLTYQSMGIAQLYFVKINNNVYLLDKDENYNNCDTTNYKYLCEDKSIKIKNLETPEIIDIPNNDLKLIKKDYTAYGKFDTINGATKLFEYENDKFVYQYKPQNSKGLKYFTKAEDGTIRLYYYDFNFLTEKISPDKYFIQSPTVFDIEYIDGQKNTDEFLPDLMGTHNASLSYAYYLDGLEELEIIAHTNNNEAIYALKNKDKKLNALDKSIYQTMYDNYYVPSEEKISFDNFKKENLLIFWEDPFGNLIEFRNAKYVPAAEFGKPIIYLYPESTTDVSVRVYPNNGLTITEPAYKDGWLVKADPSGNLYNYDDNKNYPYLFWEGYGLDYRMPQKGFVVAKNNIKEFLIEKLSEQGLIKHEYDEFIDFWLPRMQEKDYYFITFMAQSEFDKLAPLDIQPQPDTIIRVFMDYKELDKHTNVSPQYFKTPGRNGFTVVEWGGALHE